MGEGLGPSPEEMGIKEEQTRGVESDERYKALYQEASLNYLKTKDAEWFNREFSEELSPEGYLLDKQGKETNLLPSQNITAGIEEVKAQARSRFAELYPEDAQKYQLK